MKILDYLNKESIIPKLSSESKPQVLRELAELVAAQHSNINKDKLIDILEQREKLCSTAVDLGVAIPHAKFSGLSNIIAAFGKSTSGIDFESLDGQPTRLFILLVAPDNAAGSHLKLLAKISNVFKSAEFRQKVLQAETQDEIYDLIADEDEKY